MAYIDVMEKVSWVSIIEASLEDLLKLEKQLLLPCAQKQDELEEKIFYTKILIAYFRNSAETISLVTENYKDLLSNHPAFKMLARMRFLLRTPGFNLSEVIELKKQIAQIENSQGVCFAEACFVSATASLQKAEYRQAEELYLQAAIHFEIVGSVKKSIRAQLSGLAAYSSIYPESRLFHEYSVLHEKAMAAGEFLAAGTALINISRELQRIKALPHALSTVNKALEILNTNHRASREFSLAMVHRAELHLQLEKKTEGENDVIFALCHSHAEVQSACQILAQKYDLDLVTLQSKVVLPTWQERESKNENTDILTVMESRLLKLLSEKSYSKNELMDALFGEKISLESQNNRFKNLLSRVKAKVPGVIVFQDGFYSIQDEFSFKARAQ